MLSIQVAAGHYFTIQTFNNLKAKVDLPDEKGEGDSPLGKPFDYFWKFDHVLGFGLHMFV